MPGHRAVAASAGLIQARGRASNLPRVRVAVRLTPNAGVDRFDGVADGVLRARVAARPAEGRANAALIRLAAGSLGVAPSRVRIVRGQRGRAKVLEVADVDPAHVRSCWPGVEV